MGVRGKRQGTLGAVKGKGSPVVSPARVGESIAFVLPSAPFLISPSGCGGEIRNGADGSARRADAGGKGCGADFGAHSGRTACYGVVRGVCVCCAGRRGAACGSLSLLLEGFDGLADSAGVGVVGAEDAFAVGEGALIEGGGLVGPPGVLVGVREVVA